MRGRTKQGKNADALNFTRNSRLGSYHVDEEKISTDDYKSGDPCLLHLQWSQLGEATSTGKTGKAQVCKVLDEGEHPHIAQLASIETDILT